MKVTAALSILPPLMELLGGFGMAGALVYGSQQIAAGTLTPGQFALHRDPAAHTVRRRNSVA
jgi:hypothetical protein